MSLSLFLWPNNQARKFFPEIYRIPGIPEIWDPENLRKLSVSRKVEFSAFRGKIFRIPES